MIIHDNPPYLMDFDGENSGPLHWRLELHPIARLWRRKSSVHQGQQPRPPWRRRSAHGSLASAVTTRTSQLSPNHVQTCSYQGHSRSLSSLSRSISLEFHRHPYSTLGFEIILLSLSLVLSLALSFPLGLTDDCISGPLTIVRFKCSFPIGYTLLLAREPSLVRL